MMKINTLSQIIKLFFLLTSINSIAQNEKKSPDGNYTIVKYGDSIDSKEPDILLEKLFNQRKPIFSGYDIFVSYIGQTTKVEHYSVKDSLISKYDYILNYKSDTFELDQNIIQRIIILNDSNKFLFGAGNYGVFKNLTQPIHSYYKIINGYQNGIMVFRMVLQSVNYQNRYLPDFKELKNLKLMLIEFD